MKNLLLGLFALLLSFNSAWAAVNANQASVDELQTVRGIGPTIAQRIVEERRKGPFKSLDDLQVRVKGVGEASARKMAAGGLTVSGATRREPRAGSGAAATGVSASTSAGGATARAPTGGRTASTPARSQAEPAVAAAGSVKTVEPSADRPTGKAADKPGTDRQPGAEKPLDRSDAAGASPRK